MQLPAETARVRAYNVVNLLLSQVVGPLAATTEYNEPPGPPAPADASEEDLAVLQAKTWATASLAVAGIRVLGTKGRVQGYGSCSFRVEFSPKVTGQRAPSLALMCRHESSLRCCCNTCQYEGGS